MGTPMPLDRLSGLPDEQIKEILSHLPMRDVAATMLLSKRWKHLWATVPGLHFHIHNDDDRDFVSDVLRVWEGDKILKFSINFGQEMAGQDSQIIDSFLDFVKEKQVEELSIEVAPHDDLYNVHDFLYSCSSIKKLSIVRVDLCVGSSVSWNQLKSLTISELKHLSEHVMTQILLAAPLLEFLDLRIREDNGTLNIQSTSLKTLKIEYGLVDAGADYASRLRISAPNLESLGISGLWHTRCLINVPSLTAATLRFDHQDNCPLKPPQLEILIVEYEVEENKESDLADAHNSLVSETTFPRSPSLLHLKTVEISWFVADRLSITPTIKEVSQNAHLLCKFECRPKWKPSWHRRQLLSLKKEVQLSL